MSGRSSIRWRDIDSREYSRIRKNYNAKLARQREKLIGEGRFYEAAHLPPKAPTLREAKRAITTRREFNQEIGQMSNYIRTGRPFTIDGNTKKSLHATVRDFDAKLSRLEKKAGTNQAMRAALPERITVEGLLKEASSKEALKDAIRTYKGFLKPGAEELVELPGTKHSIKLTKWQKETMETRLNETINPNRERELQAWRETEVKYGGKTAGYTQGQLRMDRGDYDDYAPMKLYNYSSTYGDMREKFKLIMRESQDGYWQARTELARINYTEKLEKIMGDHPIGRTLIKHIQGLPLDDFKRTLKSEDDLFLLLYRLEEEPDNYDTLLETVWNEWRSDDMYDVLDDYITRKAGQV